MSSLRSRGRGPNSAVKAATRVLVRANGRTLKGAVTLSVPSTLATPPLRGRESVNIEEALVKAPGRSRRIWTSMACASPSSTPSRTSSAPRSSWILLYDCRNQAVRTLSRGRGQ